MQEERERFRATSYADCFKGSTLHRTLIAMEVQCLQQAQGNSFMTSYLFIFLQQVGVEEPQLIACAQMACNLGGCIVAFYLSDKIGRRGMLMGGSLLKVTLLWTTSGLASYGDGSDASTKGSVAAILMHVSLPLLN